jgi:DNA sulfur modification protein DndD
MQLLSLHIENFGLYAGKHSFDLAPRVRGGEHRPLTVFVGHNGAGKSTLFTALFVALHGPLALGERVGTD